MADVKDKEIFIFNDQPTTCPICGARSEIILEFELTELTQHHKCLSPDCKYEFIMQEDTKKSSN